MNISKPLWLTVVALGMTFGLGACGGSNSQGGAAAPPAHQGTHARPTAVTKHHQHAGSANHSSSGSGSSKPASTPTITTSGPLPCTSAGLSASLRNEDDAAGSVYVELTLTNTTSKACATGGFGGVSFVGHGNGTQIGSPAVREGTASSIVVPAGGSAQAVLRETEAGDYPAANCTPTAVDGLRIYPPNQTASLYLPQAVTGCANSQVKLLSIEPYKLG